MNEEQIGRNARFSGIPHPASRYPDVDFSGSITGMGSAWRHGTNARIPGILLQQLPQLDPANPGPNSHFVQPSLTQNMEPKRVGMDRNPTNGEYERTVSPRDKLGVSRALNATRPAAQPSLIATIIDTNSTPTWTSYEAESLDLKRISCTNWGTAKAKRTSQDLVDMRRASAHRARFRNPDFVSRRAAVANKKEADPTLKTKTSEQALR